MNYMTHTDPDAFLDFPSPVVPRTNHKLCPRCKGHGGWNLKLNAYPNRYEDTAENRHKFSHFRSMCSNCHGWGQVHESQTCVHEWTFVVNKGRCLNLYKCIHCSTPNLIDSSD